MTREDVLGDAAVVRAWMDASNAGDLDAMLALIAPDFEMSEAASLPGAVVVSGADGLRRYVRGWERNWSEADWRAEETTDLGEGRILVMATLALRGLRSAIDVERRFAYVFTIRDGRLLRQDGFDTREQALAAARRG